VMKKIFADVIAFRGTHYDFGFFQGNRLKHSIVLKNREQQWKVRKPQFKIDVKETKQVFQHLAPFVWDEFLGLQEALEWPMERVLLEFGGYRVNVPRSGCSIYVGEDFFIRNYDYHPKTYDGRFVFYQPTDGGLATVGMSQKITGRCDGLNEKGLTMGYTFMNRRRPGDGFVCYMIGRLVLECCANVDDAVSFLKEIPHRGSFGYTLFDQSGRPPRIVEASPRKVAVREGFLCTNHFEILAEENRHQLDDSRKRMAIMAQHQQQNLNAAQAYKLLNDTHQGVFSKLYGSWAGTIHTTAYFPREQKAWLALGGDQNPTVFDFRNWLAGEALPRDRVEGLVDTTIPFLNMEKADWFKR